MSIRFFVSLFAAATMAVGLAPGFAQTPAAPAGGAAKSVPASSVPAFVVNGRPGEAHRRLDPLIGDWVVDSTYYMAVGTPQKPVKPVRMTAHREWVNGGRFVREVKEGVIGGGPYLRVGYLGFSNMDRRYEWNTVDMTNTNQMTYHGRNGDPSSTISMSGTFTDQGLLGARYVGKTIRQRTVIRIESHDRNVIDLYVTPPGERERLGSRDIYTRRPVPTQEEAVRAREQDLMRAYVAANVDALDALFTDDFVFISSSGRQQDRRGVLGDYRTGRIKSVSLDTARTRVQFSPQGDTATVTGESVAQDVIAGKAVSGTRRFIRVWVRKGDGWKLSAFQLSPPLTE